MGTRARSGAEARALFDANVDIAEGVANVFAGIVRGSVERAELRAFALDGLWDAALRFEPRAGATFRAYANIRVRGAVRDGLRGGEWFQRRWYHDEDGSPVRRAPASILDAIAGDEPDAVEQLEASQELVALALALGRLPTVERDLLRRHYFDGEPFEQIARERGVSQSRISQIKRAALKRLRELLE